MFSRLKRFLLSLGLALGLPGCRPAATPPPVTVTPASYAVRTETLPSFASTALGNARTITVYLPYDYATSGDRRYPVLYANDGQDLPRMNLAATLEKLYANGEIPPIIVVAIPANAARLQEYGTVAGPNVDGLGDLAPQYAEFVVEELLPAINAQYRTRTDPQNTVIMGMSLGGLSAFDLAWQHPEYFGRVGVFSGSFWWRSAEGTLEERQASRLAHLTVQAGPKREGMEFWFEAGTHDETSDRDNNGVIDAIQDTTELIHALAAQGYGPGTEVVYVEVNGGEHNPTTWAKVLPDFLRWAFAGR